MIKQIEEMGSGNQIMEWNGMESKASVTRARATKISTVTVTVTVKKNMAMNLIGHPLGRPAEFSAHNTTLQSLQC